MKKLLAICSLCICASAFSAEVTKTISGKAAKALYTALIHAEFPWNESDDGNLVTVETQAIRCSIGVGGAYSDNVARGHCDGINGMSAAIDIADSLLLAGVYADGGMSHYRPAASSIKCVAKYLSEFPWHDYSCEVTADFSGEK